MYLKEHYVVLNRGEGNFGLHCGAILLDPIKTFGTNIMLEIYNSGDQPVVKPRRLGRGVPGAHRRRPRGQGARKKTPPVLLRRARTLRRHGQEPAPRHRGRTPPAHADHRQGQSALMENYSVFLSSAEFAALKGQSAEDRLPGGFRTLIQALDHAPDNADTLVLDYFPNLPEHIELLSRVPTLKLKRLIFRQPSRTHGFFLSGNAHARLDTYYNINLDVYWYTEAMKDLYFHTYKKDMGSLFARKWASSFRNPPSSLSTVPPLISDPPRPTASPA